MRSRSFESKGRLRRNRENSHSEARNDNPTHWHDSRTTIVQSKRELSSDTGDNRDDRERNSEIFEEREASFQFCTRSSDWISTHFRFDVRRAHEWSTSNRRNWPLSFPPITPAFHPTRDRPKSSLTVSLSHPERMPLIDRVAHLVYILDQLRLLHQLLLQQPFHVPNDPSLKVEEKLLTLPFRSGSSSSS